MTTTDVEVRPGDVVEGTIAPEEPWAVILWNDPVTPMLVVVLVLKRVFGYSQDKASALMLAAHRTGKAAVWSGERDRAVGYSVELGTAGLHATVARA